ncbi:hypothetical protein NIES30_09285 [Phormidium tenue NIES-30]|uniref:GAF domain-containing protein n=2 Tax=Phormidium tenue TaxID=126344 RepID=A0A1U7J701_9CYAN|nr:hypothetical protein NIES30_09285 [Phormidium tenue NIES-30]
MNSGLHRINHHLRLRTQIIGYRPRLEEKLEEKVEQEIVQPWEAIPKRVNSFKKAIKRAEDHLNARSSIIDFNSGQRSSIENIEEAKLEIILNSLKIIHSEVNCQVAAIFLISKDGLLKRAGIFGRDKSGNLIDNKWYKEEIYEVGKSFTGSVINQDSSRESGYGEIKYSSDLHAFELNPFSERQYVTKIGQLKEAIAVPLNGRNRTYGVLRVINKKSGFSAEDISRLANLSDYVATALSNFRRDIQVEILRYLSRLLIQSHGDSPSVYQEIADLLARNSEMPYKSCIIRVKSQSIDSLHIKAVSLWDDVTQNRDDSPLFIKDGRLPEQVVKTGKRLVVRDIRSPEHITKFVNQNWILENKLDSYGCFPLTVKGEVIGTLSLYTGFNYEFYPDAVIFIQHVADSLASFIYRTRQDRFILRLERSQRLCQNDYSNLVRQDYLRNFIETRKDKSILDLKISPVTVPLESSSFSQKLARDGILWDSFLRIALVLSIWFYVFYRTGIVADFTGIAKLFFLGFILFYVICELLYAGLFPKIRYLFNRK